MPRCSSALARLFTFSIGIQNEENISHNAAKTPATTMPNPTLSIFPAPLLALAAALLAKEVAVAAVALAALLVEAITAPVVDACTELAVDPFALEVVDSAEVVDNAEETEARTDDSDDEAEAGTDELAVLGPCGTGVACVDGVDAAVDAQVAEEGRSLMP